MSDAVHLIRALGGEMVTYTPYGGVAKSFLAIVERDRPSNDQQMVNGQRYSVNTRRVLIANDAVDGMTTIQEHKDVVRFKRNVNDAAETDFTVQTIMTNDLGFASDAGAFLVLVQA